MSLVNYSNQQCIDSQKLRLRMRNCIKNTEAEILAYQTSLPNLVPTADLLGPLDSDSYPTYQSPIAYDVKLLVPVTAPVEEPIKTEDIFNLDENVIEDVVPIKATRDTRPIISTEDIIVTQPFVPEEKTLPSPRPELRPPVPQSGNRVPANGYTLDWDDYVPQNIPYSEMDLSRELIDLDLRYEPMYMDSSSSTPRQRVYTPKITRTPRTPKQKAYTPKAARTPKQIKAPNRGVDAKELTKALEKLQDDDQMQRIKERTDEINRKIKKPKSPKAKSPKPKKIVIDSKEDDEQMQRIKERTDEINRKIKKPKTPKTPQATASKGISATELTKALNKVIQTQSTDVIETRKRPRAPSIVEPPRKLSRAAGKGILDKILSKIAPKTFSKKAYARPSETYKDLFNQAKKQLKGKSIDEFSQSKFLKDINKKYLKGEKAPKKVKEASIVKQAVMSDTKPMQSVPTEKMKKSAGKLAKYTKKSKK